MASWRSRKFRIAAPIRFCMALQSVLSFVFRSRSATGRRPLQAQPIPLSIIERLERIPIGTLFRQILSYLIHVAGFGEAMISLGHLGQPCNPLAPVLVLIDQLGAERRTIGLRVLRIDQWRGLGRRRWCNWQCLVGLRRSLVGQHLQLRTAGYGLPFPRHRQSSLANRPAACVHHVLCMFHRSRARHHLN